MFPLEIQYATGLCLNFLWKINVHGFCVLFLSFNGQSTKAFLFSPSFPHVFKQKLLCLIRKQKEKANVPFLLLDFSIFLLLFSKFQHLKGSGLAHGPGSQDSWARGSLVGRKEELCPTL